MPAAVTTKEFLQVLWGDQTGVAELAAISPKKVKPVQIHPFGFFYPTSLDSFIDAAERHNRTSNVYMGVCLRRQSWPTGSRGTEELALSSTVVAMDVDFEGGHHKGRVVNKEAFRKLLSEFPLKPSIVVSTGGGVNVYWLLKEPAVGAEMFSVKKTAKAVGKYFNGDPVADLARVLRLPGSVNHNTETPVQAVVSFWHPQNVYTLLDFDFLPEEIDPLQPPPSSIQEPKSTPGTPSKIAPAEPGHEPRPTPTFPLDDDVRRVMGKLFSEVWFEGWRHEMALCVGGWLAFSGVRVEDAREIVRIASEIAKGDTVKRVRDVEDTYRKFISGGEVKGRPSLETMVDEAFPPLSKDRAKKTLAAIQKLMPRPKGTMARGFTEPDFKILWLSKYTSSPPVWTVTLEKEGQKIVTKSEHSRFMKYEVFVEDVCDQNTVVPQAGLKNPQWRGMINEARRNSLYEEQVAPPESRPAGAIERGLDEFLSEAHHNPDIGILKKFPGTDDDESFFRLETFREFLADQGRTFTPSQLTEKLKAMGWGSKVRRFGKKTPHVWSKAFLKGGSNGNGNGNGHDTNPTAEGGGSPPPKVDDLFPTNGAQTTDA